MRRFWFLLPVILGVFGCATAQRRPPKTQLQIREMQTRTYNTKDMKLVVKAILNVLQDDDYIVKQANLELGFVNATKEIDLGGSRSPDFFFSILGPHYGVGYQPSYENNAIIECTANISEFGAQTRVRVNFQSKVLDNRGVVVQVHTIQDDKFYQDFFAKVDKGIFLQKEKL